MNIITFGANTNQEGEYTENGTVHCIGFGESASPEESFKTNEKAYYWVCRPFSIETKTMHHSTKKRFQAILKEAYRFCLLADSQRLDDYMRTQVKKYPKIRRELLEVWGGFTNALYYIGSPISADFVPGCIRYQSYPLKKSN